MSGRVQDPVRRFWRFVAKRPSGCWEWTGGRSGGQTGDRQYGRYGAFHVKRGHFKCRYAHRFSYMLHIGPIPEGMVVCHTCDNPLCVNPAHLFAGTVADNNRDMRAKSRHAFGERHGLRLHPSRVARGERQGSPRLTASDVQAIRDAYVPGRVTQRDIAQRFGVSREHVRDIILGKRWGHLAPRDLSRAVSIIDDVARSG